MRILSYILNIALLLIVLFLLADEGWPKKIVYQLMFVVFLLTPLISVFTLWRDPSAGSESWLSLMFERKKLEEKLKMKKLKDENNEI